MFLRRRATQAEYFDQPQRTPAELRDHYRALNRINRWTHFDRPFRIWLPRLLGEAACHQVTALDLGSGEGMLGRQLTAWASTRSWQWEFTNLDLCPVAAELDPNPRHVVGSVLQLPFPDRSFDVVVASTMTHHLASEAEVVTHFREAYRVARGAILICDLHRNLPFLISLWAMVWMSGESRDFRNDGVLSVRRGWSVPEWRRLVGAAQIPQAKVWAEHGTRVLMSAQRPD